MNTKFFLSRFAVFFSALILFVGFNPLLKAQSAPKETIQSFKSFLDKGAVESLCKLMAESDGSGPLRAENFDAMRASIENLIPLWRGQTFYYYAVMNEETKNPPRAVVTIELPQLKHYAKFTLLRFNTLWYIADIEIVFK